MPTSGLKLALGAATLILVAVPGVVQASYCGDGNAVTFAGVGATEVWFVPRYVVEGDAARGVEPTP